MRTECYEDGYSHFQWLPVNFLLQCFGGVQPRNAGRAGAQPYRATAIRMTARQCKSGSWTFTGPASSLRLPNSWTS